MDYYRCFSRSFIYFECMMMFMMLGDYMFSSIFFRMYYSFYYDIRDDCVMFYVSIKINRIFVNFLDQFERQLSFNRDGYYTLQYKRTVVEYRSDSFGRIRYLVYSVQKFFIKLYFLEGSFKGSVNGGKVSFDETQIVRYGKRSKSKERRAEFKVRFNIFSGWWSSDDNLDGDMCIYYGFSGVMIMGRCFDRFVSQYFMEVYNIISEQAVKVSRSNNDVKCFICVNLFVNLDVSFLKKSVWFFILTVSRVREVYQKVSVNMDQVMVKLESC